MLQVENLDLHYTVCTIVHFIYMKRGTLYHACRIAFLKYIMSFFKLNNVELKGQINVKMLIVVILVL